MKKNMQKFKIWLFLGYILFFNTLDDTRTVNSGHDDPVAVIEDLYVKTKYRNRGIATQLWRKVLKVSILIIKSK